jgi:hypothetical protein
MTNVPGSSAVSAALGCGEMKVSDSNRSAVQ